MKIKVLVYPQDANPYQQLLYRQIKASVEITYLKGLTFSQTINNILLPLQLIFYRAKGYRLFHLHWVYGFTFPGQSYLSVLLSTIYYYLILIFIKLCGYKIVWTVHNVLPHKTTFVNDITARKFLSRIVSAKIIHSASTMEEMKKYLIDTRNCNVIPIGNFIDVYPNTVSKQRARAKLKIHRDDFVFLFLGKIEPYKGIEKLINEFSKMNLSSAKLIIAGKCTDVILQKQLATYKHLPGVMIINQFIPNSDIQLYFNAADIAVYPFERVTTSSSVLLPLSFSKSIIYPRVGNLKELPDDIGYSYKIDDPNGLRNCINTAFKEKESLNILNSNAFKYAYKLSWKMIAQETTKIYSELTT